MLCIYSFSGTVAELATDIVPAYIRKNDNIIEEVRNERGEDQEMPSEWYQFLNK